MATCPVHQANSLWAKISWMLTTAFGIDFNQAHARCPLCTDAVGAAAVSAKYYGMDTSIIGLLIGAFGASTGLWLGLKIKKQFFKFQLLIIMILSFLLTVVPLLALNTDYLYMPMLIGGSFGSIANIYFKSAFDLWSMFFAINMKIIEAKDLKTIAANENADGFLQKFSTIIKKIVDCCKE